MNLNLILINFFDLILLTWCSKAFFKILPWFDKKVGGIAKLSPGLEDSPSLRITESPNGFI